MICFGLFVCCLMVVWFRGCSSLRFAFVFGADVYCLLLGVFLRLMLVVWWVALVAMVLV